MAARVATPERYDHGEIITIPVAVPRVLARSGVFRRVVVPKLLLGAADIAALVLAMFLAYIIGDVKTLPGDLHASDYALLTLVSIPAWIAVFARYGLYASRRITGRLQELRAIFHGVFAGSAVLAIGAYYMRENIARRWVLLS